MNWKKGDIGVRVHSLFNGSNKFGTVEGDICECLSDSLLPGAFYYNKDTNSYGFRKASTTEIEAFHRGVRNIKNLSLQKEDLVKEEIYFHDTGFYRYIIKYLCIKNGKVLGRAFICIDSKAWHIDYKNSYTNSKNHIREATTEEKIWYKACEEQNKFVSKEEAMGINKGQDIIKYFCEGSNDFSIARKSSCAYLKRKFYYFSGACFYNIKHFVPSTEEIEHFLACEKAGKYVEPVLNLFKKGDLVIETSEHNYWWGSGEILVIGGKYCRSSSIEKINEGKYFAGCTKKYPNGNGTGDYEKISTIKLRHVTKEEEAYFNEVGLGANINNMVKQEEVICVRTKGYGGVAFSTVGVIAKGIINNAGVFNYGETYSAPPDNYRLANKEEIKAFHAGIIHINQVIQKDGNPYNLLGYELFIATQKREYREEYPITPVEAFTGKNMLFDVPKIKIRK